MKILTLNTQQNMALNSPNINQNVLHAAGGGSGSTSKEFTNSNIGGSSQNKSNKRDQKHSGGTNKKFMHGNGNAISKPQLPLMEQQHSKYHNHNSNNGTKNKKQHYNNSNTTSSLNRKKYYQQQQQHNVLQQQLSYQHQQQYLTAIQGNQPKSQTSTTTPPNSQSAKNNNNNSHLVKNQNYTNMNLFPNAMGNTKDKFAATTMNTHSGISSSTSQTSNTSSSTPNPCPVVETFNNGSLQQKNDCNKVLSASFTDAQYKRQNNTASYDSKRVVSTTSASTTETNRTSAVASPHCKCCTNFKKLPQTTNIKTNKSKTSATNNTSFDDTNPGGKCNCDPSSTDVLNVSLPSSSSVATLPVSTSKRKSFWKNSNSGNGAGSTLGGGNKVSINTKSNDNKNYSSSIENLRSNAAMTTSKESSVSRTSLSNVIVTSTGSIPSNTSSADIPSLSKLTLEMPQQKNNSSASHTGSGDLGPKKVGAPSTHHNTSSPNSYTLDFLHSVGVQMADVMKHDATTSGNNMSTSLTATNSYGNHVTGHSPARGPYPYNGMFSNQRHPRYIYGGGNNHHPYQQHHHHQPSPLTIASFLQKDLLNGSLMTSSSSSDTTADRNAGHHSNGRSNSYSGDQQTNQQQYYVRSHQNPRYYNNYYQNNYAPSYATQQAPFGYSSGNNGELPRIASNFGNQRPSFGAYHHCGTNSNNNNNNAFQYHNTQFNQEQSKSRLAQGAAPSVGDATNKKSTQGSSSSASSCSSSSSSSSTSSNSSFGTNRKQQQASIQNQHKISSNLNFAMDSLSLKSNSQRQAQHHRDQQHSTHGHNSHLLGNTPSTPQHQNYFNLPYLNTDEQTNRSGSISETSSRCCSPAPQSFPPTPVNFTHSPKSLGNLPNVTAPAPMLPNIPVNNAIIKCHPQYQHSTTTLQQFQQHPFSNKRVLVPLTLGMPSPSSSPTPSQIGALMSTQQPPLGPHNIICCSQLDEATTAAAAAKAGIIAGNDYDSDASSTHSSALGNTCTNRKYQPLSVSTSSLSSVTSLSTMGQQPRECPSASSTTSLNSPIDYAFTTGKVHTFPKPNEFAGNHNNTHKHLNHTQLTYKTPANTNATSATQLPHIPRNTGVISLLNLPNQSANNSEAVSATYLEDFHQRKPPPPHLPPPNHNFYQNSSSAPSPADHLNVASTLSAATSRSNSSSGYWSPSHQCNMLYQQLSSEATCLMLPSCDSSSSSISPSLIDRDRGDELRLQQQLYKRLPSSGSTSPSPVSSSCVNEQQFNTVEAGGGCPLAAHRSSNTFANETCSIIVTSSEKSSAQLLPQQQRLIAQPQAQITGSTSSALSSSGSTSTQTITPRMHTADNSYNQQYAQNQSLLPNSSAQQQLSLPHIFSHQMPPPPHNLLYNPQTHHHMRTLSNSSIHDYFTHTPPDRFLARAHLIEAKEAPASLLNNSKYDRLSHDIWKKFISSQQTEETFKQKMHLWRYLYLFIKNAYPRYGLYLVGSTISGFGSDTSDVDMCLVSRSASNIDPRMEALFNLTVLRDFLSKSGEFEQFNLIEAKVPILRFRDRVHQLEVDLNFNNCVGIKNTHLLYCYSQLDWRLRPLVLVTKLWAQHHNINNAKNMTISSYSLVLMVIHFLQYAVNPPVLPCLHDMFPDKFPLLRSNDFGYVDMNETIGPFESNNNQTVGELFLNFLEYYSRFDFTQHSISVRTGGVLAINICRNAKSLKNDIHQWKELCIEEPFDLTNTARSVYDFETFERVKTVFVSSWHILKETLDLNSVFSTFVDITMPPPSQMISTTTNISATHIDCNKDDRKYMAEKINLSRDFFTESTVKGSTINDQLVKYSDLKQMATLCVRENDQHKVAICRNTAASPSMPMIKTPASTLPPHQTLPSFSRKHGSKVNNKSTPILL